MGCDIFLSSGFSADFTNYDAFHLFLYDFILFEDKAKKEMPSTIIGRITLKRNDKTLKSIAGKT